MKIKTITCHHVYNVGASLQAFALQHYLESIGHETEIIDFKPPYLSRHYSLRAVNSKRYDRPVLRLLYLAAKFPRRLKALRSKKKQEFDEFRKNYLKLTKKTYHSNEELKEDCPAADAYIAGSDQIWNPLFENGKDPAFFLDFVNNGKRIAYAASFAVDGLPKDLTYRQFVTEKLSQFDAVSVREKSGVKILESLGLVGEEVCDPVFLLSSRTWEETINTAGSPPKYVFLYDFDNSPLIASLVKTLAEKQGLRIKSYFSCSYAEQSDESGPLEFLNNILNAELVISNSFHATAFSLIFHKDFLVIGRKEAINSRMKDLLENLELEDRFIESEKELSSQLNQVRPIDWEKIDRLLAEQITKSKAFLQNALEN